ncbi:protein LSM12 homolog A [Adelges cooleyi]|uniref:protein LSM12 homolog A n=1 Tax=Adelges cooleyi TaxID=133065 RepID=UPI00217F4079|nr:protein LSM12 homolog A [Adelges cooleyi]XP_050441737.1 protein LSM12 homolog A [Adelges cooleyi]
MAINFYGKHKMAGVNECFSIGSVVMCTNCFDEEIEGEVLGFEPNTKMLILKCPSTTNNPMLNDINIVNLAFAKDVQVKKESNFNPPPLPSLNLNRLNNRVKTQIQDKKRQISAMSANVSPEAQKLYLTITKTIPEVSWQGQNIVVYDHVIISPPYKPENVKGTGNQEDKAIVYIKNIVEKHVKDNASVQQLPATPTTHRSKSTAPASQSQ